MNFKFDIFFKLWHNLSEICQILNCYVVFLFTKSGTKIKIALVNPHFYVVKNQILTQKNHKIVNKFIFRNP